MRLTKTVDGKLHTYLYEGGLLVQETRGDEIFDYSYDANGSIRMLKHRATESATPSYYYYALNSRNDVVGLYNSSGAVYAKYTYDPWGNIISITDGEGNDISNTTGIAVTQPFRYRSYYYDTDSKFYYLQSRYYDPVTHRFINADGLVSTGTGVLGHNMFAYCDNNPVNRIDPTGNSWFSNAWNKIKNVAKKVWNSFTSWCSKTFGVGKVLNQKYKAISIDTIVYGEETGTSTTGVISGDTSKPVSFFVETSTEWWKTAEIKLGLQINLKNGYGASFSTSFSETNLSISNGKNSITGIFGTNKIGYTISYDVNFANHTASSYYHQYIRTLPAAAVVVGTAGAIYYTGGYVLTLIPTVFSRAFT